MSLDRKDIYDTFMKTRPSHIYDESVPLWHMVHAVQRYLQKMQTSDSKLPNRIHARPCELPALRPLLSVREEMHILYHTADPFKARLVIAECLGTIVLQYMPEKLEQQVFSDNCVLFFAQEVLKLNAQMENGAMLRKFPVPFTEIPAAILSYRGDYSISDKEERHIKKQLTSIFPKYPNIERGYRVLSCELDIMAEYIVKNPLQIWGKQTEDLHIGVHPSRAIRNGSYSKISYYDDAINIWHITLENAADELARVDKKYDISLIRLAIAHDLGHAVLPQSVSVDGNDDIAEREASYFARLMLRRREWLYNGCKGGEDYDNACEQWDKLLRHIHRHDNKELIDWVLTDDEWLI